MLLADYPGPKAQIQYADQAEPTFFCDTVELFSTLLSPEQVSKIDARLGAGHGQGRLGRPRGHWIDAAARFYVLGQQTSWLDGPDHCQLLARGRRHEIRQEYGGNVLRFGDISPDMVDLSGGALHDQHM